MGTIIGSRAKEDGKVVVELLLDYDELIQLHGYMDGVHIFSERAATIKGGISHRGKNDATKYFLIPRELRKNLEMKKEVSCQRIDTKTKTMFVYVIDKLGL